MLSQAAHTCTARFACGCERPPRTCAVHAAYMRHNGAHIARMGSAVWQALDPSGDGKMELQELLEVLNYGYKVPYRQGSLAL